MVGGDQEDFDKALDKIDCYSKKVKLLGKSGSGQLAKMVNQICIAGLVQGLSEAINFGQKAGLNMEDVIEVISKGAAQSWQMENRYKTMLEDKFDFGFAVDWMRKDLKIAMEEAKNNGSLLPIIIGNNDPLFFASSIAILRSFLIQSTANPKSNLSSNIVLYRFSICQD